MCAMFTLTIQICFSKKVAQKTLFIFVKGLKETGTRFAAQILYCLSLDFDFYIVFNEFGSRELPESLRHGSKILLFACLTRDCKHARHTVFGRRRIIIVHKPILKRGVQMEFCSHFENNSKSEPK